MPDVHRDRARIQYPKMTILLTVSINAHARKGKNATLPSAQWPLMNVPALGGLLEIDWGLVGSMLELACCNSRVTRRKIWQGMKYWYGLGLSHQHSLQSISLVWVEKNPADANANSSDLHRIQRKVVSRGYKYELHVFTSNTSGRGKWQINVRNQYIGGLLSRFHKKLHLWCLTGGCWIIESKKPRVRTISAFCPCAAMRCTLW